MATNVEPSTEKNPATVDDLPCASDEQSAGSAPVSAALIADVVLASAEAAVALAVSLPASRRNNVPGKRRGDAAP